jgi:dihydrofolate reductase
MAKLIYSAFTSLDGYVADETGNFDWAELGEEVFAFINDRNDRERQNGTYLLGRKIVYSRTLQTVSAAKTRLEREFDADAVRKLKAGATRDVAVGGPGLAAHAIRAGLVDEYHLLIAPIIAGSGNPYLPGNIRVKLELLDGRRFDNGLVYVRYRASPGAMS